jgi:hypothetical protein
MIYETRVYRCLPGRLPALLKRFETITLKLWEKHGIRLRLAANLESQELPPGVFLRRRVCLRGELPLGCEG